VTAAAASARDADFEKQLNDIGFLQQMEWISTQQAIQMLTAMASYTAWTPQQYQQLLAKIKELTDAAKTDYQFNLPGNIDLPTLYETRRLNQTPGGSGYNDNRVVTINFTANNTADAEAIANTIVDGFSAPSRFGTASRRY
jgi:uncharacterized protein involved in exopolysaccharide biosynthesis